MGIHIPDGGRVATSPRPIPTPEQIALDADNACMGPDHKWMCPYRAKPKTILGEMTTPVVPPSWQTSLWVFNGTPLPGDTCTSDDNTCTATTCGPGGVGPCVHVQILTGRWGTQTPNLAQSTTVQYLSNFAPNDWWTFIPNLVGANGSLFQSCTFVPYFTTTITTYTAFVRCVEFSDAGSCIGTGTLGLVQGGIDPLTSEVVDWSTACGIDCTGSQAPWGWCTGAGTGSCAGAEIIDAASGVAFTIWRDLGAGLAMTTAPEVYPVTYFGAEKNPANGDTIQVGHGSSWTGTTVDAHSSGLVPTANAEPNTISGCTFVLPTAIGGFPRITVGEALLLWPYFEAGEIVALSTPGQVRPQLQMPYINTPSAFIAGSFGIRGGALVSYPNFGGNVLGDGTVLDGDTIFYGSHVGSGTIIIGTAYMVAAGDNNNPVMHYRPSGSTYASNPVLWGPSSLEMGNGTSTFTLGLPFKSSVQVTGGMYVNGQDSGAASCYGSGLLNVGNIPIRPDTVDNPCNGITPFDAGCSCLSSLVDPAGSGSGFIVY
jgi:hypothetical protein